MYILDGYGSVNSIKYSIFDIGRFRILLAIDIGVIIMLDDQRNISDSKKKQQLFFPYINSPLTMKGFLGSIIPCKRM